MSKYRLASVAFVVLAALMAVSCPGVGTPWRSALYPADWTPAFEDAQGRFLHDFSYAGYANGEAPLPASADKAVFDAVAAYGADNTGATDATAAIQAAIGAAEAAGGVVHLPAGLYRCDGLLTVTAPGVVVRGEGPGATRVFFTQVAGMTGKAHLTFRGSVQQGGDIPLAQDGVNRSFTVRVTDATGLAPDDEVALGWVITDEFIAEHNMTGTWQAFNGKWRPILRRTVVAVDLATTPHTVTLDVPLRYPAKLRDSASLRPESGYLAQCGLEHLAVSNAVDYEAAWGEERVHAVHFIGVKDCWMLDVQSFASSVPGTRGHHLQNGGVRVLDSKRVTVAETRMEHAENRGGGGCGYLFEVSRSSEVLFRDCVATAGRHNFIQNWDFGSTGCVWLRCSSAGSRQVFGPQDPIGLPAFCEYHHSLAMACLVDQCTIADGWYGGNRHDWSSGAGLTCTQSVYWNTSGGGHIRSWQYGHGYVIGTDRMFIRTDMFTTHAEGSTPPDYVEGPDRAPGLTPQSLYEDQLKRRIGR